MARIRTIKPEFWTSEQVAECSPTTRLLFIGMWNFADDGGNQPASLKSLKMKIFPSDSMTLTEIGVMVEELLKNGLLMEYSVSDKKYWHITGWHHQKIEKPSYKYPQPIGEYSASSSRTVGDRLPADVDVSSLEVEGKVNGIDGESEFEHSCSLYPKPERSNATQVAYFEAIGWIRKRKNVSDRTAIDYLNNRIGLYRNTGYPCGFRKFLIERIFEQDESQWKEKGNGKPKGALGVLEQLQEDARQLDSE